MRSWGQVIKKRKKWNKREHGVHPCGTLHRVSHRIYNKPCAKHSHRYHEKNPCAVSPPGVKMFTAAHPMQCVPLGADCIHVQGEATVVGDFNARVKKASRLDNVVGPYGEGKKNTN